tara:strand:- start:218 stop:2161 length:1944 start_codon:yes stop_codon:yes gene_type:complete
MANQFAKKSIDFDVYERQDPASLIDWGKQAKVISDTFTGIAEEREKKKAAIEKSFADQQAKLNELGEYDNPTAQQIMMNAGTDGANKLLDVQNLVKRGLMKPSEATMFKQNQLNGFNLLKKNMANFDKTFQNYTKRLQDGTGAPAEQYLATLTEGFANLNNISVQTDPTTGNVSLLRIDPKTGKPVKGGDSMTVNRLTLLMKQQIDNFDIGKEVVAIQDEMGTITRQIATDMVGPNVKLTKEIISRAETEFGNSEKGKKFLDLKVQEIMSNPMDVNSMIINADLKTDNGESYKCGSQEDYDKWMAENNNDEKNNPFLVLEFGEDNQYKAVFNETQKEKARDYVRAQITGSLDYEETETTKSLAQTQQPNAASIAKSGSDKKLLSKGKNLMYAVSGDAEQSAAGLRYLVDASNGTITNMEATDTGFIVTYPGRDPLEVNTQTERDATQEDIDTWVSENPGKTAEDAPFKVGDKIKEDATPEESMRLMWKASGLSEDEFDAWLDAGGRDLLKDRKTTRNVQTVSGPQKSIPYDTNAQFENADGVKVTAVEFINDSSLGESLNALNDSNNEVVEVFTGLLAKPEFFPKEFEGSVRMDGNTMYFTINGKEMKVDDDVFAMETAEIVSKMQEMIQKTIKNRKGGGNASQYNK